MQINKAIPIIIVIQKATVSPLENSLNILCAIAQVFSIFR